MTLKEEGVGVVMAVGIQDRGGNWARVYPEHVFAMMEVVVD